MKESISVTLDAVQKKKLMEEAHKRNLTLKEYLKLKINICNGYVTLLFCNLILPLLNIT